MVDRQLRLLLPRWVRSFPADLAAVVGLVALALLGVALPGVRETPLRVLFGLPFVLFLPGYALVSILFPEGPRSDSSVESSESARADSAEPDSDGASPEEDGSVGASPEGDDTEHTDSARADSEPTDSEWADLVQGGSGASRWPTSADLAGHERVVAAIGLSVTTVPLLVMALNFTPYGIQFRPVLTALSALTLGLTAVAAVRRWSVPEESRFRVPYRRWIRAVGPGLVRSESGFEQALNVVILLALLVGTVSAVYAVSMPDQGQTYTEFYVLSENETGELEAAGFPTEFAPGEQQSAVVGIDNREGEQMDYTVVVELQRVATGNGSESAQVLETQELRRFQTTLGENETWRHQHALRPRMTGQNLRLQYMLYRGNAPQDPDRQGAYRAVHFWVNVTASGSEPPSRIHASPAT